MFITKTLLGRTEFDVGDCKFESGMSAKIEGFYGGG